MFKPQHCGLYFSEKQLKQLRKQAQREPLASAYAHLHKTHPVEQLPAAQWNGLRYRFDDDSDAGAFTVTILETLLDVQLDDLTPWQAIVRTLTLAQCIELIRDHPETTPALDARWRDQLFERVGQLNERIFEPTIAESLWLAALNMAAGIVLEREPIFEASAGIYRSTIDNDIHPEGYLPAAIESGNAVINLRNQIRSVQALVLMAEMARHVGVDLWGYENRGVSVTTATTYPLYYYFYPEKWKWVEERYVGGKKVDSETLDPDEAQRIFKENAGFLEMLNWHYGARPLKAIRMILEEIRPVVDLYGGGLTTLTHGYVEGRRGLFG